ncbi:fibro-slime domain-containing protein [Fibrobacterota bacterium]
MKTAGQQYQTFKFGGLTAGLFLALLGTSALDAFGKDTLWIKATIYDHYAMTADDSGYFEFNPDADGSSSPGICEQTVSNMVKDTLEEDSPPSLDQYVPCAYNNDLERWFTEDAGNIDPAKRVIEVSEFFPMEYQSEGVYNYNNPSFFPLDGKSNTLVDQGIEAGIEGPDSKLHNFGFTVHLRTEFTYRQKAANNSRIAFTGGDDFWVYIDNILIMDFGGIHNKSGGPVHLKQLIDDGVLELEEGENYTLDFFYAKRHTHHTGFNLSIHLDLLKPAKKFAFQVFKIR